MFLDEQVYVAGDDLRQTSTRRIRMSRKLVLVVRPQELLPHPVRQELGVALASGRVPAAIDITGALAAAPEAHPIKQALQDKIFIAATLDDADGKPGAAVVMALARSFKATRQHTLRTRALAGTAALLAVMAALAFWPYREARANAFGFYTWCEQTREQERTGLAKLDNLGQRSVFGRLVADIAQQVANLPDPASLQCDQDPR